VPVAVTEHTHRTARHTTHYLAAGPEDGAPIFFIHGWPELAYSWRNVMPVLAGLGFRAIAPDMRGYGKSSVYPRHEDYALEHIAADMVELADHLGVKRAVWVGHDWGAPVVWTMAQQHPDRCLGVASLCVPYQPEGFAVESTIPLVDRSVYPEATHPAGQWDYQLYYREDFAAAQEIFDADPRASVKVLFRAGTSAGQGKPAVTAAVRANGGWFGPARRAPDVPLDTRVLSEADAEIYVEALARNGFFGPNSWYMNAAANLAFAKRAQANWTLKMPVLFLHGRYDYVCATVGTRLADPMRAHVSDLTEAVVDTGHWMAQEKPAEVSAHLVRWLAEKLPALWPARVAP
jgi:pimeloyl-ACP methyl ester carboxylesterase